MIDMPIFLENETEEVIRSRMLAKLPSDLDKTEGSVPYDIQAPLAAELAQAKDEAREFLRQGFITTAAGIAGEVNPYVDLRLAEHGLTRRQPQKATGTAKFAGTIGTQIPAGTKLSTASTRTTEAIGFITKALATIGADGTATVAIEAEEAGSAGNIPTGKIIFIVSTFEGMDDITSVTNENPTSGGLDVEDDPTALERFLRKVRSNSAGGNKADYINWAYEVPGVGGVAVIPVRDGAGTVSVAIIDTNKIPASAELVNQVQDYIAPRWENKAEAAAFVLTGYGVVYDGAVNGINLTYSASGEGQAAYDMASILQQPGIWKAILSLKVDSATESTDLLEVGIWNKALNQWAQTTPSSGVDAVKTVKGNELTINFTESVSIEYYWNSIDDLELRVTRKQTDTSTAVNLEYAILKSTFSTDRGDEKAPVGHRVTVEAAKTVLINVSVHLSLKTGTSVEDGQNSVNGAIEAYLKSIAFMADNDVGYNKLGNAIYNAEGIEDFDSLTINGTTSNITIPEQSVAIKGTVTFI